MKKYINHGAIWKKKDKNGNTYLGFKASRDIKEGESINFFSNDKGDNQARPDFKAYDVVNEDDNLGTAREALGINKSQEYSAERIADDIPF